MLSSQYSELQSTHRRQNSTPTNSRVAAKAQQIPVTFNPQHQSHHRGLSLDPAMYSQDSTIPTNQVDGTTITNIGLYEQHKMREAQTHGLPRPGHDVPYNFEDLVAFADELGFETEHTKESGDDLPNWDLGTSNAFGLVLPNDSTTLSPSMIAKPNPSYARHQSQTPTEQHNIESWMFDSRMSQSQSFHNTQSSLTRKNSNTASHTQFGTPMKRGSSNQESSTIKRSQSQSSDIPFAPNTAPLQCSATFDAAPISGPSMLDISALNLDFTTATTAYNSANYSPMTNHASPVMSSFQSSPELGPISLFGDMASNSQNFPTLPGQLQPSSPKKSRSSSPRKKAQLMPEDMILEDTGVTNEQVDAFIQGPDSVDGKFTCLYEGCNMKPFARKENIKAHVQTHLNDRKYVCTHCQNRFVRPNDLKRHKVIHEEAKDFVCKCGAAFGRKDALRRHRIRKPFCVDGDPTLELMRKEEKKRGRPKKIAPTESPERRQRKETVRKQVMEKTRGSSVASSIATSHPSPPADDDCPEEMHFQPPMHKPSPFEHMSYTPPASPEDSTYDILSPLQSQTYQASRGTSLSPPPTRDSMMQFGENTNMPDQGSPFELDPFHCDVTLPSLAMQSKSSSQYGTPPELGMSSSPLFKPVDFEHSGSNHFNSQASHGSINDLMLASNNHNLDDMFTTPLFSDDLSMPVLGKAENDFHHFSGRDTFWDDL